MNDEQFLDGLFEAVDNDVETTLQRLSSEELRDFVREFVLLCSKYSAQHFDIEGDPVRTAASAIFLAKLFPLAFRASYSHTDKMLRAEDSIRKALEDL